MKDDWNHRNGIKGFGFRPSQPDPETSARWAVEKHKKFLGNANRLELFLLPIGKKNERAIVKFLYGNANATMDDLRKLTEDEEDDDPPTLDALRKTIERLNDLFSTQDIPLEIVKRRSNGKVRVYLDVYR